MLHLPTITLLCTHFHLFTSKFGRSHSNELTVSTRHATTRMKKTILLKKLWNSRKLGRFCSEYLVNVIISLTFTSTTKKRPNLQKYHNFFMRHLFFIRVYGLSRSRHMIQFPDSRRVILWLRVSLTLANGIVRQWHFPAVETHADEFNSNLAAEVRTRLSLIFQLCVAENFWNEVVVIFCSFEPYIYVLIVIFSFIPGWMWVCLDSEYSWALYADLFIYIYDIVLEYSLHENQVWNGSETHVQGVWANIISEAAANRFVYHEELLHMKICIIHMYIWTVVCYPIFSGIHRLAAHKIFTRKRLLNNSGIKMGRNCEPGQILAFYL